MAVLLLALTACQNLPPPYPPPEQRLPIANFRPYRAAHIVDLSEGDRTSVVADIQPPAGGWSWTGKRPAVKVPLRRTQNVHFKIDFAVADSTFQQTGPVSITFLVNGHALETRRYSKPGEQHYEKEVPAEWLEMEKDNLASAEIDKLWTSPDDGTKLGFILIRMGLIEQ